MFVHADEVREEIIFARLTGGPNVIADLTRTGATDVHLATWAGAVRQRAGMPDLLDAVFDDNEGPSLTNSRARAARMRLPLNPAVVVAWTPVP